MLRALGRDRASEASWSTVATDLRSDRAEVIHRTPRVHQLSHYWPIHEAMADRTRSIRMLEIGSFYGDSLHTWQKHLHPDSVGVGIDIDSKLVRIVDSGSVHVRIGDEQLLGDVTAEFGPFDVIIDAGSLTSSRMVNSFRHLFEDALSDGGVYILGDVYCDFWTLYNSFSFTDVLNAFMDIVRGHYRFATDIADFDAGHLVVVRRATKDLRQRTSHF